MPYTPATSEAEHITNRLRIDATDGLALLNKVIRSITDSGDISGVTEQLARLYHEHGVEEAGLLLVQYSGTLAALGDVATTFSAGIDPSTGVEIER